MCNWYRFALFSSVFATFAATAEVPSGAVIADTAEKEVLISSHLIDALKGHPEQERGRWVNTLPPKRRDEFQLAMSKLPPDKRDEFYTAKFMSAYESFGDVRTRPYCAFSELLNGEPLLYGNGAYSFGNEHGDLGNGEVIVGGRSWSGNLDPKKMGSGYDVIAAAQKQLGQNARLRHCYRFVRVEEAPGRPSPGIFHKRVVLEWLGGDLVDFRNSQSLLAIPTSWALIY